MPDIPAIGRLPPSYGALLGRAAEVFHADERVRALWVGGSVARGDADAASDLDLLVAIADDGHEAFAAAWQDWLADIASTVIAKPLWFAPGSLYSVTGTGERLDVVVEKASAIPSTLFRTRVVVFDRDGLHDRLPGGTAAPGPDPAKVAGLVEELFRDYVMSDILHVRDDRLLGLEAVHHRRTLLYQLFTEANAPLPMMGVKRWSDRLTDDQRAVLESFPAGSLATVKEDAEAVAVAFVREARPICERLGVPWPDELHAAAVASLKAKGLPHLEGA